MTMAKGNLRNTLKVKVIYQILWIIGWL